MRILLYGMQSSGASLVTYFLAQSPRSVALIDVWARHLTPMLAGERASSVIAKCTVTTEFTFDEHASSFRPDRTILILRDPVQNYASLRGKEYVAEGGDIDEKFRRLESVFRERERFDLTLAYETFVQDPESTVAAFRGIGVDADSRYYRFRRSTRRIKSYNFAREPWCSERFGFGWGFGNVQGTRLDPSKLYRRAAAEVEERVRALCPSVCSYYEQHHGNLAEAATRAADGANSGRSGLLTRLRELTPL